MGFCGWQSAHDLMYEYINAVFALDVLVVPERLDGRAFHCPVAMFVQHIVSFQDGNHVSSMSILSHPPAKK